MRGGRGAQCVPLCDDINDAGWLTRVATCELAVGSCCSSVQIRHAAHCSALHCSHTLTLVDQPLAHQWNH